MNAQFDGCIGWISIISFCVIVGAIVAFFRYIISNKKKVSVQKKLLLIPPVFIFGFILYIIGYYDTGTKEQLVTLVSRSFISAIRMFFSFSDVSGIRTSLQTNQYFMLIFSVVNLFALLLSFVVVLQLLGDKVSYWFKYYFSHPRICYVFFDTNEAAIALAKNIFSKDKDAFVIFIRKRIYSIDDDKCKTYFEYQQELLRLEEIRMTGAIVIEREYSDTSSLSEMGVARLLRVSTECHFFFLSGNENNNIRLALSVDKQKEQNDKFKKTRTICHVLYSSEQNEKVLFKYASKHHTRNNRITFINPSQLSALRLITLYPPVNFINIDTKRALAKEDFNVMLFGFGEIGQYTLRYLIEQGQFVGSTFHAMVIDEKMDKIIGLFNERYPGIKDNYTIDYECLKKDSVEYFNYINSHISSAKYIVVAYGNDRLNVDAAIELKDILIKQGLHTPIFVNLKDDQNLFMSGILGKFTKDKDTDGIEIYCTENGDEKAYFNIYLFGMNSNIFSYDNVIDESIIKKASKANKHYREKNGEKDVNGEKAWYELRSMDKLSNISQVMHLKTKLLLLGLKEKDVKKKYPNAKSFSESLSEEVKLNLAKTEHLRWNANYFVQGWQTWHIEDLPEEIIKTGKPNKDFVRELHVCLISWDDLPTLKPIFGSDYQSLDDIDIYDFCES
jgi:hypothetical protein